MGIFDLPTGANPAKDTPVGKDEMGRTIYETGYGARYVMPDAPKPEARFPTNFAYEMTTPQERAAIAANPPAPQPEPNILSGTGIMGTLGNFNQMLNPIEAIGQSMSASQQMLAPETAGWDRVTALGNMLSGVAGVTAPAAAAYKAAMPAATALMESLLGWSPLRQPILDRATQPGPMPTLYSNPIAGDVGRPPVTFADAERAMQESQGIRAYQGSPHNFAAERLVRMPDGSTQYIVGRPDVLPDVPAGAEVLQDFPLGRMRMDKLGTGEGAQAFGPGLYTAENEGIARHYRDMLATPGTTSLITRASPDAHIPHGSKIREIAASLGDGLGQTPEEFKSSIVNRLRNPPENAGQYEREELNMIADDLEAGLWDVKPSTMGDKGSMYEVNINADPKAFLDWDIPLGQQPESVRSAFSSLGTPERLAPVMGENAYRALEDQSGSLDWPIGANLAERNAVRQTAAENARKKMLDAGIPGIKYLDQGSRNQALEPYYNIVRESDNAVVQQKMARGGKPEAPEGFKVEGPIDERTRNFVVFDENLISIVRKYGIAGAAVMLGTSADQISQTLTENMTQEELNNLVSGA